MGVQWPNPNTFNFGALAPFGSNHDKGNGEGGWGASEKRLRTVKGAENLITAVRSCNSYTFTFIVPLNGAFIRSNHGLARNCDVTTRRFRAGLPSLTAEPAVAPRTVAKLFSESTADLIFGIFPSAQKYIAKIKFRLKTILFC